MLVGGLLDKRASALPKRPLPEEPYYLGIEPLEQKVPLEGDQNNNGTRRLATPEFRGVGGRGFRVWGF